MMYASSSIQHPSIPKSKKDQIFNERLHIASGWYDTWTDGQRKKLIKILIARSRGQQLNFMFENLAPRAKVYLCRDFTEILPRHLSLKIMSYLDVYSLCQCAQVSWMWRCLSEDNSLWKPNHHCSKIIRLNIKFGSWKHLFRSHLGTERPRASPPGKKSATTPKEATTKPTVDDGRMAWQTKISSKNSPTSNWFYEIPWEYGKYKGEKSNRVCSAESKSRQSHPEQPTTRLVSNSEKQTKGHISPTHIGAKHACHQTPDGEHKKKVEERFLNSRLFKRISYDVEDIGDLKYPNSGAVFKSPSSRTAEEQLGCEESLIEHPRVIFLSSNIQAPALLLGAVRFDIISIPYDFDSATYDILISRLKKSLDGKSASSIGFFCHTEPGVIDISNVIRITLETLHFPDVQKFLRKIANFVHKNGSLDLLSNNVNLSSDGFELIDRLQKTTFLKFGTIADATPNCLEVESIGNKIIKSYFNSEKFTYWSISATMVDEAIGSTKASLHSLLRKHNRVIAKRLSSEIITKAMACSNPHSISEISPELTDALIALGAENPVNPKQFLCNFLQGNHTLEMANVNSRKEKDHGIKPKI
eukprot:Sdes_comp18001_c0_seq1m7269